MQKTLILLVCGFMIFLCISLSASDYHPFIVKGDEYYQRFDNLKALAEYQKAYNITSDNYEVIMKLTRAYNDIGEDLNSKESKTYFKKAVEYAEMLAKKFPNKAEAYFYLAESYGNLALLENGKEKVSFARDIKKNARKATGLDPKFSRPYVVLGRYYREVANLNWLLKTAAKTMFGGLPEGTNEDSERMLLKSIELQPSIYANFELAKTYKAMKEKDKSINCLKKILELPIFDHQDKMIKNEAKNMLDKLLE
jgi:tetratricopeptide (TPR) repeat protein